MKAGAQDKRSAAQEYDLVLPDAVEFIASQALQGTLVSSLCPAACRPGGVVSLPLGHSM